MSWLQKHLDECSLNEECEGYLYGRGASDLLVSQCKTWEQLEEPFEEDPHWRRKYGPEGLGEWLRYRLIIPLYSPRGPLIGFEGRSVREKKITRYLIPDAEWNPIWIGMSPEVMLKLWEGGSVWIVEGAFDVTAMSWVIPKGDVVLASVRAKLTRKHVEFLKRFCRGRVYMVYDNDEGGRKGVHGWVDDAGKKTWGALESLAFSGVPAQKVRYKGGDPGDIWDAGGVAAMLAAFPNIHLI